MNMVKFSTQNPKAKSHIQNGLRYLTYGDKEFSLCDDNTEIGKVKFEGYIFDRDSFVLKVGVSDKQGFKEYLDTNGGIRVYRDGLRVYDYGEVGDYRTSGNGL